MQSQSILIPYHKDKDMLHYCLKRIIDTIGNSIEIVIIGNNINESELDLEFNSDCISYYRFAENLQYPKAVNIGVERCSGEIITIVDPDVFVWDNWYQPMLEMILANENIGIVGANLINPLTNRILDFGIMYSRINSAHTLMGRKHDFFLATENRRVQAVCSAILMTRKSIYEQIGGMDNEMPYSYTDCDYCLRARDYGYETWVSAKSKAYHKGSTDSNNSKSRFNYYHGDAKGIFGEKDYPRLCDDMNEWYKKAGTYARSIYSNMGNEFLFADLSSMYDKAYYRNVIETSLDVAFLDEVVVPPSCRDANHQTLYGTLSYRYIDIVTPILYFVDTYTSLLENSLWFNMRNIENDYVVDRHGNIVSLLDIAEKAV